MGVASMYIASSSSIANGAVSEAKLATAAVSVAKMKNEGTATQVLTSNGAGSPPSYQPAGAVSGTWTLVSEGTLASNTLTFSSLSGQYLYMLVFKGFQASDNVVLMEVNGDSTAAHYTYQEFYYSSTTASGGRGNAARIFTAQSATYYAGGITYLWRDSVGQKACAVGQSTSDESGAMQIKNYTWGKTDATIAEITSITIHGAATCTGKVSLYKISLV